MAEVSITEVERALTEIIADWLMKTVDSEIFRGEIPSVVKEGVGVTIRDDLQENERYIPHFNFQIAAKYADRDNSQEVLDVLRKKIPAYGMTQDTIHFLQILKRGYGDVFKNTSDGTVVWEMFYNGRIMFRNTKIT